MPHSLKNHGGAVGIWTGYGLNNRGVNVRVPIGTWVPGVLFPGGGGKVAEA
jgi:hypothetical protein